MRRAVEALLGSRHAEGCWRGGLAASAPLEFDYVMLQLWLHPPVGGQWTPPGRRRIDAAARSILSRQRPGGGFPIYPGGPAHLDSTIKAYCALKLAGFQVDDPRMARARERILERGGLPAAGSGVKAALGLFGLYPARGAAAVSLGNAQALRVTRPAPEGCRLDELLAGRRAAGGGDVSRWRRLASAAGSLLRGRKQADERTREDVSRWLDERFAEPDEDGATFQALTHSIIALEALGRSPEDGTRRNAEMLLDLLIQDKGERLAIRPYLSPVPDSATAALAIGAGGTMPAGELRDTAEWLQDHEVGGRGCWRSGPADDGCPSVDATAMALLALKRIRVSDSARRETVVRRAARWLRGTQSGEGGWAAFDAAGGPAYPDVTGRVVEALCESGAGGGDPAVRKAADYLVRTQKMDGSWNGRWGVNHIYGACWALRGLRAAGESDREAHVLRGGEWLRSIQNPDGGWGESCVSYETGEFEPAPSAPSQTAWAILGLIAAGDLASDCIERGVRHLIERQKDDGTWDEEAAAGTGIPGALYVTHDLYRVAFPLWAIGAYRSARGAQRGNTT